MRVRLGTVVSVLVIILSFAAGLLGAVFFDWIVYQTPHWGLWQRLSVAVPGADQPAATITIGQDDAGRWEQARVKARPAVALLSDARGGETVWQRLYQQPSSRGAAIILSADGLLVTLDSVGLSADQAVVAVTADGLVKPVVSVFDDPASPFTFLTVAGSGLAAAPFVTSEQILLGQAVARLSARSSASVVSSVTDPLASSTVHHSSEWLAQGITISGQSELADAVITSNGDVVGLTSTLGVIVPLYHLSPILKSVLTEKLVERPRLGVNGIDLSLAGLTEDERQGAQEGMLLLANDDGSVPAVREGSPAAAAGLRQGDIITAIDDTPMPGGLAVSEFIQAQIIGETITIHYRRDSADHTAEIILGKIP